MVKKISAVDARQQAILAELSDLTTRVTKLPEQIIAAITPLSAPPVARFYFNPEQRVVKIGQEFLVEIRVDTLGAFADAAQAVIRFDPVCLSVLKVLPGIMFETIFYNQVNNANGSLSYAAGVPLEQPAGLMDDGTLLTIRCKALVSSNATNLAFDSTSLLHTKLAYQGYAVPALTESKLTLTILQPEG